LNKTQIHKAAEYLEDKNQLICIVMHAYPDGDAVGSALGLYDCLKRAGYADVQVIAPNPYASFLHWMPHNEKVIVAELNKKVADELIQKASLLFCLDFNGFSRTDLLEASLRLSKAVKIMIDHHPQPEGGFDLVFSDTNASSTAEMIYEFIASVWDERLVHLDAAKCLYAGIVTDTGSFSYGCNNPRTYEIVGRLIATGVDGAYIHRLIYSTYSADRMRLLGFCLSEKLVVLPGLRAAYISLSKKDLKRFNYQEGDTEGVVNYALAIKEIELAALFTEKKDHIKVSLRSVGDIDVNELARVHFNGGGHKNASGGKSFSSLDDTVRYFVALLEQKRSLS